MVTVANKLHRLGNFVSESNHLLGYALALALCAGCATSAEPVSEADRRWLSTPFDDRAPLLLPRTARSAASHE